MNLKSYKFIFVTRESKDLPGARYRAYNLAESLEELGYDAAVFSYHDNLGAFSGGLEKYLKFRDKLYYNKKAYKYLKRFDNLILIIQRLNYHSFAPLFYALRKGVRYIYDLDDWEFKNDIRYYLNGLWSNSKAEFISRIVARKAFICLAGSTFLLNYLQEFNCRTFYLPPGIDLRRYSLKKFPRGGTEVIIGWIGTMFRKEDYLNLKFIIEVMSFLRHNYKIVLEIAGEGMWREKIEEECKNLGLENIRFQGWIPPAKICSYLDHIDIGVFPIAIKNKFIEAKFPVKVLEFMAKGIPVIASNFGEVSRIIKDGRDGFLVESKENFLSKILVLANNASLRKDIGFNAREKVEKEYDLKKQALKFIDLLENVSR